MGEAKRRRQRTEKKLTLDDLVKEAERHARREYQYRPHGDHFADLHIMAYERDGHALIIRLDWEDRAQRPQKIANLRQLFREKNVFAYATLLEGWASAKSNAVGWMPGSSDEAARPREQDDRIEFILATACNGAGYLSSVMRIERSSTGRVQRFKRWEDLGENPISPNGLTSLLVPRIDGPPKMRFGRVAALAELIFVIIIREHVRWDGDYWLADPVLLAAALRRHGAEDVTLAEAAEIAVHHHGIVSTIRAREGGKLDEEVKEAWEHYEVDVALMPSIALYALRAGIEPGMTEVDRALIKAAVEAREVAVREAGE
jgi:hypothetical protein